MKINTKQLLTMLGCEDSDGVARVVDVNTAAASATKDHPAAPEAEANSDGVAAGAADTVSVGDGDGVTPAIQDAINEGVQVGEDVTKMEAAKVSAEHHLDLVSRAVDANEAISPALAKAIKASLERFDADFFGQVIPSVEAFAATTGRMTATMNTQAHLVNCIKGLTGAIAGGKDRLSVLKASLESAEDGTAVTQDVKEVSADITDEVDTSEPETVKGSIDSSHNDVAAGQKDYTAIDAASEKQGQEIHKRLERLHECDASLEAFIGAVDYAIAAKSSIGGAGAAVIRQSLTQQYPKFFKGVAPSLEAFDDLQGATLTESLGDQLRGLKVRLGTAIANQSKK